MKIKQLNPKQEPDHIQLTYDLRLLPSGASWAVSAIRVSPRGHTRLLGASTAQQMGLWGAALKP